MNEILMGALFGVLGGFARLLVVVLKTLQLEKKVSSSGYWVYVVVVISVGAFSGIILSYGKVLSFLAGYAGLDLIEGYYKQFMKKRVRF